MVVLMLMLMISVIKALINGFLVDAGVRNKFGVQLNVVFPTKSLVMTVVLLRATLSFKLVIVPTVVLVTIDRFMTLNFFILISIAIFFFFSVAEMVVVLVAVRVKDLG